MIKNCAHCNKEYEEIDDSRWPTCDKCFSEYMRNKGHYDEEARA